METTLDLFKNATIKTFSHDSIIVNEGVIGKNLYILIDGNIEITKNDIFIAKIADKGAFIGEVSLLLGLPYSATCRSIGESKAYELEITPDFLERNPRLLLTIAKELAAKLNKANSFFAASIEMQAKYNEAELRRQAEKFSSIVAEMYR